MRHSVKRTFVFLCVGKYTHIRLQKRFKFAKRKFFQEARRSPPSCNFKRTQGLSVSFHIMNHLFRLCIFNENRHYEPPVCRVE
jgi:hypothetical protein